MRNVRNALQRNPNQHGHEADVNAGVAKLNPPTAGESPEQDGGKQDWCCDEEKPGCGHSTCSLELVLKDDSVSIALNEFKQWLCKIARHFVTSMQEPENPSSIHLQTQSVHWSFIQNTLQEISVRPLIFSDVNISCHRTSDFHGRTSFRTDIQSTVARTRMRCTLRGSQWRQ